MKNLSKLHKFILPGICIFLAGIPQPSARADILALDWSHLSGAYASGAANATTPQSFTVGSNTVSTVFALDGYSASSNPTNPFILNTPINSSYSSNNSYASGGISDTQLALQIGINLSDNTTQDVKFTINFSTAVYGATFTLFDIDANSTTFVDEVHDVVSNGSTNSQPTITGSSANQVGSPANNATAGYSNSVTGVTSSNQNLSTANATFTFPNDVAVTSISFIYGSNYKSSLGATSPQDSGNQLIGVGNIYWSTVSGQSVPEPGTLATVGLGLASMTAVVLRRRRS